MSHRRLPAVLVLPAATLLLAACGGGEPEAAPTVTVTTTVTATPSPAPTVTVTREAEDSSTFSAPSSSPPASVPRSPFLDDLLSAAPALDTIVDEDLITMGQMVCSTLNAGATPEVVAEAFVNGNAQLTQSEADALVDAAQDNLC